MQFRSATSPIVHGSKNYATLRRHRYPLAHQPGENPAVISKRQQMSRHDPCSFLTKRELDHNCVLNDNKRTQTG